MIFAERQLTQKNACIPLLSKKPVLSLPSSLFLPLPLSFHSTSPFFSDDHLHLAGVSFAAAVPTKIPAPAVHPKGHGRFEALAP